MSVIVLSWFEMSLYCVLYRSCVCSGEGQESESLREGVGVVLRWWSRLL